MDGGLGAGSSRWRCALAVTAALAAAPALAEEPVAITAARRSGDIHLDGRLDEEAWRGAPVHGRFVESFPATGRPANLRTEVRVVYDDDTLHVGVTCLDPSPALISAPLARRDTDVTSDRIEVALDTGTGGRAAYVFGVNAAGVQRDVLLYANVSSTDSWDAVWDAAVRIDDRGWTAELAIPLHQLRFPDLPEQRWRMVVRRHVPRTHQILDSTLVPPNANPITTNGLVVARFGPLEGVRGIERGRALELLPYVATRAVLRPQYSDPARPDPRLVDPAVDVGLDLRTALGRRLTLTAAVNPDFGQIETDEVIQNLSTAEQFFPEKRPFFLEGLDVFQPVGVGYGTWMQLFYSRRIGLDAPILAAGKVTGAARRGLEVGFLDAVVTGAANESLGVQGYLDPSPDALAPYEANPDRRWRFRWRQPFHLGPEDALPAVRPVTTNYLAAVARQTAGPATYGAMVTAATPLEDRCQRSEFATEEDYRGAGCEVAGANAAALDVSVPGDWGGFAQVQVSQVAGGPSEGRVLADGTVLRPGDLGYGGHLRWGKLGGEPWRFDVVYAYVGKKLELNAVGFQPLNDFQWADVDLGYVRPSGLGPLRAFEVKYNLDLNWSTGGEWVPRGVNTNLKTKVQLPGYETVALQVVLEDMQYDSREIPGAGIWFQRDGDWFAAVELGSDPSQALAATGNFFVMQTLGHAGFERETGLGADLRSTWRPHARFETRLDGSFGWKPQGPRWVETLDDGTAIFGLQDPVFLSLTLRQQVVFTPRLTAQLYVQLFSQAIRWGKDWYAAPTAQDRIDLAELEPVAYGGNPSTHLAVVNVNAVLRWEYRLGSTLYLVYTRSQSELPAVGGVPGETLAAPGLFQGPVTDTVMVKWTWWRG